MKSTILHATVGKVPLRTHVEAVLKAYPTVLGHASQYEGAIEHGTDEKMTLDELMQLLEGTKEGHRVLFFADWEQFEDETDIQPFIINNAEGAPVLAWTYEGGFEKYKGLNGKHTAEFCLAEEIIFDRMAKEFPEDADVEKFIANLKSSKFKQTLTNLIDTRGWFTFLPITGDPWAFGNNDKMQAFDWGSLSNNEGIVIEEPKPVPKEEPKKSGGLSFLTRGKPEAKPTPTPEVKPVNDPAPKLPASDPSKIDQKTDSAIVWTRVQVPPQLQGSVRNHWIRMFSGDRAMGLVGGDGALPGDHLSKSCHISVHPSLVPFTKEPVSDTKSIKALRELVLKGKPSGSTPLDMKRSTVREPASNYTSVSQLSEQEINEAMEKMIKFLDNASKVRPNPIELQKSEAKWPLPSEKLGFDFNEYFLRSDDEIYEFFGKNALATACFIEMRRFAINASGIKMEDLVASTKVEETKGQVNTEAVNDQPVKKSGLAFLNRKKPAAA